jgi:hypothetical protein
MARPSHQAPAAAAGLAGLLLLCGCGSSAAPAAGPAAAATTSPARLASRFCTDASGFMRTIPATPKTKNLTPTQAQADMSALLVSTVTGFTRLEEEAPARLHEPLKKIISVYKSDEEVLRKTGDMAKVSESMVRNEGSGSTAFQKLIKYIAVSCR